MSLTIDLSWESAPDVRAPELRAAWARLRILVGDEIVTLAKSREAPSQLRDGIDVSAYPLAEWLALNWWALEAGSHTPDYAGLDLTGAGEGFPWPALILRSDRKQVWLRSTPRHDPELRVSLLGSVDAILDADQVRRELSLFIDATVRRLDEAQITGTLLQEEWSAIQAADAEEREFAIAAAAWGFDPYNMNSREADQLVSAASSLHDGALLADLARALPFSEIRSADDWVSQALQETRSTGDARQSSLPKLEPLRSVRQSEPWREGYRRAQELRQDLELAPNDRVPLEDFVAISRTSIDPPKNVDALASNRDESLVAAVGPAIDPVDTRARFIGARTIARRITDPQAHSSLLTRGSGYTDKFERAFAAEFLAPAAGIRDILQGDFSDRSQTTAASTLGVSERVIGHQIENQILL